MTLFSSIAVFFIFLISGDIAEWLPYDFWTLNNRVPLWVKSFEFIQEHPFLGVGYFASRFYILEYFPFAGHAHNSFVEAALTTGIIGLTLMLVILIYGIAVFLRSRDTLLLALIIASILGSLFNPVLIIPNVTTFVLVFVLVASAEYAKDLPAPGYREKIPEPRRDTPTKQESLP